MRFFKQILRLLFWIALIAFVIYTLWGRRFFDAWRYWRSIRTQREHLEADVKRYRLRMAMKQYFVRKLMTDADFRERAAREHVDYVSENEYVIYFSKDERLPNREKSREKF